MPKNIIFFGLIFFTFVVTSAGDCSGEQIGTVDKSRKTKIPIYLRLLEVDNYEMSLSILPHASLVKKKYSYSVSEGERIIIACPGSEAIEFNEQTYSMGENHNSFIAVCNDNMMRGSAIDQPFQIGSLLCANDITLSTWEKNDPNFCIYGTTSNCGIFISMENTKMLWGAIQTCSDSSIKSALYSIYTWSRSTNPPRQKCSWTSNFLEKNEIGRLYSTKSHLFDKGHLTPDADMTHKAIKGCSFLYDNAAPQYYSINRGIWSKLERTIRKVTSLATIITGTSNGNENSVVHIGQDLDRYLTKNPDELRIPRYFWKIVVERDLNNNEAKTHIFVSINRGWNYDWNTDEAGIIRDYLCNYEPYKNHIGYDIYCPDKQYLRENFPEIRKVLEYLGQ